MVNEQAPPVTDQPASPSADGGEAARVALAKQAGDVSAQSKAASDKMRDRADTWGKTLTTLGTAAVGYLGINRATDVFPIPPRWEWLTWLSLLFLALMGGAAVSIGIRLSRAGRPIVMKTESADIPDTSKNEKKIVKELYDDYAKLNGYPSLKEYDDYGQGIAAHYEERPLGPDPIQVEPFSRATQIRAEVQCAQQRGATLLVRHRVSSVTTGPLTIFSIGFFLAAGVAFGVSADKIAALREEQADTFTLIKGCGDAIVAKQAHNDIAVEVPAACWRPTA